MPFKSLGLGCGAVSYSPSIVTMVVSVAVCEIFNVKDRLRDVTLKMGSFKVIGNGTI